MSASTCAFGRRSPRASSRNVGGVDQLVQIAGALLILAAFAGAQFGRLDPRSLSYLWLNLVGAVILGILAAYEEQLGFLLLETVWAIVSLVGLIQVLRERSGRAQAR